MLTRLGYRVVCAANAAVALAEFDRAANRGEPFKAVVLDLTVPGGMGGVEEAAEIRKRDAEVRLFVVSGYADNAAMQNPREYGFSDSLRKPFTMAELAGMLSLNLAGG